MTNRLKSPSTSKTEKALLNRVLLRRVTFTLKISNLAFQVSKKHILWQNMQNLVAKN
jgi:hypothetical protein